MRFAFIDSNCQRFPVSRMCLLLNVSSSGYYSWKSRPESTRNFEDRRLLRLIQTVHQGSRCSYGSPRIWRELRHSGESCGLNRVARIMQKNHLESVYRRRKRPHGSKLRAETVAANLLEQDFTTAEANRVWTADITYLPTCEGWLFLAVVMDLFSRKIVGWAMDAKATRHLVIDTLMMAVGRRDPTGKTVHHSDRGSQYGSYDFQKALENAGITCSMSGKGNCYDNAAMESFFKTLKIECIQGRKNLTRDQLRTEVFEWIESWYNRKRRHSYLDYLSPVEFEERAITLN